MNAHTRQSAVPGLLILLGLLSGPAVLQNVRTAAADSPAASATAVSRQQDCRGVDSKAALERADAAARSSRYRQAGECYLAAGDKSKADVEFVKAAAADATVTKRQVAVGVNQAKAQFRQLREAFASH